LELAEFTSSGGKLTINTKVIYPVGNDDSELPTGVELAGQDFEASDSTSATYTPGLSVNRLQQLEDQTSPPSKDMLVVRFEITDTGIGIKREDIAEHRLFSPYVQTDVGRMQGGKGTGLGLSLVRQIVMLSGGRLGVKSKSGEGSTFWVELPFAIGAQTKDPNDTTLPRKQPMKVPSDPSLSKDRDASPLSDSSASDYRFVSSLRDPTVNSIDESFDRTRTSSLSIPASNASPAPSSPARGSFASSSPADYNPAIQFAPTSSGESTIQGHGSPAGSPSGPPATFTSLSGEPGFDPNTLQRPEPHSHVSTQSAPAHVTLPSSPMSIASAPTVTSVPSTPSLLRPVKPPQPKLEFADGPLRVLVVDDDNLTRRLMSRMMSRLGCTVEAAENGKIALDLMLAANPVEQEEEMMQSPDDIDAAEKGQRIPPKKKIAFGIDPRSGVDAHKNFDITFLDNQVR